MTTRNISYIERWVELIGLNRENPGKIEHFDDRRYRFSLFLLNQDGAALRLRKGAIEELYIEDNIMDWFHHGYLLLQNPNDVIERAESVYFDSDDTADKTKKVNNQPYRFRGDGRDLILLTFEPYIDSKDDEKSINKELNNAVYTMKFLFTIYATEDVLSDQGRARKMQKMYFHDYRYQMLREKNLYYSTAKNLTRSGTNTRLTKSVTHLNNADRGKPTGEIIQDILRTSMQKTDTQNMFSKHWDFGGTSMFYTSPANFKAIDDLEYLLDRHVSVEDGHPCLFRLQRFTERWELLPIQEYFRRSREELASGESIPGVYQSEFFILSNDSESPEHEKTPAPRRKTFGRDVQSPLINYHFTDLSVIDDYIFSEMNGSDCQEIMNSVIVHRYNEGDKRFGVDLQDHNINSVAGLFQGSYVSNMFGFDRKLLDTENIGTQTGALSWLTDSSRVQNFNFRVESSWTPDKTHSLSVGRNKLLLSAFLLGNTIQFTVRGDTSRRAGVWIAVDRDTNYLDNEYDKKVLGQYFVTRVTHKITQSGEYQNTVMGVKPYFTQAPDTPLSREDAFMKNTDET